ncbi:hypothetical protein DPEC_G00001630 [Dallia pectoralis]|uniref:Uncharacterized protein n=1 Tax=Dallia pectoralis TaxID=75939 RepID=A0ACC2HIR5_DALPE|nr:hypothetical protein DPEC_G00001630 [Dallia pectoralis]
MPTSRAHGETVERGGSSWVVPLVLVPLPFVGVCPGDGSGALPGDSERFRGSWGLGEPAQVDATTAYI